MPQVFGLDRFGVVTKVSSTLAQVNLSDQSDILVRIGGQQYRSTSVLQINTAVSGAGGLDTGTVGHKKVWFIHFVLDGDDLAVVASESFTAPTGFSSFVWSGYFFFTDTSAISFVSKDTVQYSAYSTTATVTSGVYANALGAGFTTPNIPNSQWQLQGQVSIDEAGVVCQFNGVYCQWSAEDGDGTVTQPAVLNSVQGGIGASSGYLGTASFGPASWEFMTMIMPHVIVGGNTEFYVTPNITYGNPGTVGIRVTVSARRIV